METYKNYINGEWTESKGGTFESKNPSNGEPVARAQNSTLEDARTATRAAREAFDSGEWSKKSGEERGQILFKFSEKINAVAESLARIIAIEMGKPYRFALEREVKAAAAKIEFFAGLARTIQGETDSSSKQNLLSFVLKEPVGVCALITPWNDPIDLVVRKMAPALAVGCAMILKPSSLTPASSLELIKIVDEIAGIPKGVVNAITGSGSTVGAELVRSGLVDKVSFTGEAATGKSIMEMAAGTLKRISLECGGKAANIIYDDANLEKAQQAALYGAFLYTGQSCTAGSRLLLQKNIHDEFLADLVEATKTLRIGDPLEDNVTIGPLVSADQERRVLSYIERGKRDGAILIYGGRKLTDNSHSKGFYVEPAIFDCVTPEMSIAQEEIFGPVLSVMSFDDEEDAIRIANSTRYGLGSAVWSQSMERVIRTIRGLRAGDIWVNTYYIRQAEVPFGGFKESGIGRELGREGLEEYLEIKHVCIDTAKEFHIK